MPTSRNKAILSGVGCAVLGALVAIHEAGRPGFGTAAVFGIIAGLCLAVAILVLVGHYWSYRPPKVSQAARRREARRVNAVYVPVGLFGVGIISAIGAVTGGGLSGIGVAAAIAASIFLAALGAAVLVLAFARPELWN